MKNFEKYKTAEERRKGFRIFCDTSEDCVTCRLYGGIKGNDCISGWLELECEEKLLPCPFCGSEAKVHECEDKGIKLYYIECCNECCATAKYYCERKKAIENWNRRTEK